MRIAIMGAGCMGGLIGGALQSSGAAVTLVDQGERLKRLQSQGLRITRPDGSGLRLQSCHAVGDTTGCGAQDIVIVALKAHQIPAALDAMSELISPDTTVVTLQNGIPWWYFQLHGGPHDGQVIQAADPGGLISARIDPHQIVGCIAYAAAMMAASGHIVHVEGNRFPVGALDGRETEHVIRISELFQRAGFKSPVLENLRAEVWLKAVGIVSFNPISALTQATLVDICEHPDTRMLATQMMKEAETVANRLDIELRVSIERRIEGARRVGKHRSSMLQDVENGEPMELDAVVTAVVELGELTGTDTPTIRHVLALTRLLNQIVTEEHVGIARRRPHTT